MNWYIQALKHYAVFNGRAGRKEYWYFFLFNALIFMLLTIADGIIGTAHHDGGIGWLGGIYLVLVLIPNLAVIIRRLHDSNRSGWWALTFLIPIVGLMAWLFLMIDEGTPEENRYGSVSSG